VKVKHAVRFFTAGCILNKFPVLYHEAYRNNYKLIDISGRQMDLNKWGRGQKKNRTYGCNFFLNSNNE
jgi:hypothetical protein